MTFSDWSERWIQQQQPFTSAQWLKFVDTLAPFPFSPALLEVDQALWGSFWQGDVIAPGYLMPALELTYLRLTHLDNVTLAQTPTHLLNYLNRVIAIFPQDAWHITLRSKLALCLVYQTRHLQANVDKSYFMIWLVDGFITTCYFDDLDGMPGHNLSALSNTPIVPPQSQIRSGQNVTENPAQPTENWAYLDEPAKIDSLIQLHRLHSQSQSHQERQEFCRVLEAMG